VWRKKGRNGEGMEAGWRGLQTGHKIKEEKWGVVLVCGGGGHQLSLGRGGLGGSTKVVVLILSVLRRRRWMNVEGGERKVVLLSPNTDSHFPRIGGGLSFLLPYNGRKNKRGTCFSPAFRRRARVRFFFLRPKRNSRLGLRLPASRGKGEGRNKTTTPNPLS